MGTAPAWLEGRRTGSSWTEHCGGVEIVRWTVGMTCHSLLGAERGAAGVAGARLSEARAQQAGVAHLAGSKSQHLQVGVEPLGLCPATAEPDCKPVKMHSTRTSNADKVFRSTTSIRIFS